MIHTPNYFGVPLIIGIRTKLYANDILFFEGEINYARVHFKSGKQTLIARTLSSIANLLWKLGRVMWCFRIRRFWRFRDGGGGSFWLYKTQGGLT
jgi:hypothetical protein